MFTCCLRFAIGVALALTLVSDAVAQVHVRSYTRKDGTVVKAHQRSRPDSNFWNNYSTIGNINPHTGEMGTKRTPPIGYGGGSYASAGCSAPACNLSRGSSLASTYASRDSGGSGYSESSYSPGGIDPETERERVLRVAQQKRDDEKARRERSRAAIPVKHWTDEERAESKFRSARQLYYTGHLDASKRWLETVVKDFPTTNTADRAKIALAKF